MVENKPGRAGHRHCVCAGVTPRSRIALLPTAGYAACSNIRFPKAGGEVYVALTRQARTVLVLSMPSAPCVTKMLC